MTQRESQSDTSNNNQESEDINYFSIKPRNEEEEETSSDKHGGKCISFFYYIAFIFAIIIMIMFSIYVYFSFAGIVLLTFYDLIHNFISLFTKDTLQIILSVLYIFSNFGLTFTLSLFCFYLIRDYISFIIFEFKRIISPFEKAKNESTSDFCSDSLVKNIFFYLAIIMFSLLFIYGFTSQYNFYIIVFYFEVLLMLFVVCGDIILQLGIFILKILDKCFHFDSSSLRSNHSENENFSDLETNENLDIIDNPNNIENSNNIDNSINNENSNSNNFENSDNNENSLNTKIHTSFFDGIEDILTKFLYKNESLLYLFSLKGMFDDSIDNSKCIKNSLVYKIIIIVIISALQLYHHIYEFINNSIHPRHIFGYIFVKLICCKKLYSFN